MAGPGMVLSFAIAGFTALLAGICFAEFASAIPRTGSGYLFTYVSVILTCFFYCIEDWFEVLDATERNEGEE